jgi:hypothetical protein
MAGRLGHIDDARRVAHIATNGIRKTNAAYGFTGVIFWLDADFGTSTKTNATPFTLWIDKIKNIKCGGAGGSAPIYNSSDVDFNNLPSVSFSGARRLGLTPVSIPNKFTIVFVFRMIGAGATRNSLLMLDANNTPIVVVNNQASGYGTSIHNGTTTPLFYDTTISSTNPQIVVLTRNNIIVNGVQSTTGGTLTIQLREFTLIGGFPASDNLNSVVAELLIYDGERTLNECFVLSDRINTKYAIY